MDQDSTNSGERRNWRERLGIAKEGPKDLPKIAEEFVSHEGGKPGEPRLVIASSGQQKASDGDETQAVPQIAQVGSRVQGAAPVRPAPMAPRPAANGTAPRPQGVAPQSPQQAQRPPVAGVPPKAQPPSPVRVAGPPQASRNVPAVSPSSP